MSLLRRLQLFCRTRLLGRVIAATLLLATSLAQPGAAPVLAAPAAVAPLAPQTCSTLVANLLDDGSANTLRTAVACATSGQTVTISFINSNGTVHLTTGEIPIT